METVAAVAMEPSACLDPPAAGTMSEKPAPDTPASAASSESEDAEDVEDMNGSNAPATCEAGSVMAAPAHDAAADLSPAVPPKPAHASSASKKRSSLDDDCDEGSDSTKRTKVILATAC